MIYTIKITLSKVKKKEENNEKDTLEDSRE